jgi:hypothetical protein
MTVQMSSDPARARRYLLGELSDDEQSSIERDYLASESSLDRISAAEEILIEEYLDGTLDANERHAFERRYLESPARRLRIETVRHLRAATNGALGRAALTPQVQRRTQRVVYGWLAAAAVILIAAGLGLWRTTRTREANTSRIATQSAPRPEAPAPSAPPAPSSVHVVAFALSPIATRSQTGAAPLIVPPGTDAVALELQVDAEAPPVRVVVSTVSGDRSWIGTALTAERRMVRVSVPAAQLPPDDYIVTLYARKGSDDVEQHRYFLRVRAR